MEYVKLLKSNIKYYNLMCYEKNKPIIHLTADVQ